MLTVSYIGYHVRPPGRAMFRASLDAVTALTYHPDAAPPGAKRRLR